MPIVSALGGTDRFPGEGNFSLRLGLPMQTLEDRFAVHAGSEPG
jgi:hypothetical protein